MSTTALEIVNWSSRILGDDLLVRWSPTELYGWITAGQEEAVGINNNLFTKKVTFNLAAGSVQSLTPITDYYMLLDVPRNMGLSGSTPGRVVTKVSPTIIDAVDPLWHAGPPDTTAVHYMFSADRRFEFMVYPPMTAGYKVELLYAAIPPVITGAADLISLPDTAAPALADYVCWRAKSKDTDFAAQMEMAMAHYKLFAEAIKRL